MTAGRAVVRSSRGVATTEDKSQAFAPTAVRRAVAYLVYTGGAVVVPPRRFGPLRGATLAGREVASGLVLASDKKASRHHATFHASPTGAVRVVDEQSRNGTWVNGARVADQVLAQREAGMALKAQAVLFRSSSHSAALELELTRRRIPFVKFGGLKFIEAAHVKDILAVLRWAERRRTRPRRAAPASRRPGRWATSWGDDRLTPA